MESIEDYSYEALRVARDIAAKNSGDDSLREFLSKLSLYVSQDTPSHKRSHRGMFPSLINMVSSQKIQLQMLEVIGLLEKWEESLGYRENILTIQEHELIGSSNFGVGNFDVYTPLCFLKNPAMTLEEVRVARRLEKYSLASTCFYFIPGIEEGRPISILLEDLDDDRRTVRDPTPLDRNKSPVSKFEKSEYFPYERNLSI